MRYPQIRRGLVLCDPMVRQPQSRSVFFERFSYCSKVLSFRQTLLVAAFQKLFTTYEF